MLQVEGQCEAITMLEGQRAAVKQVGLSTNIQEEYDLMAAIETTHLADD